MKQDFDLEVDFDIDFNELEKNKYEEDNSESCSLDDDECVSCGS